MSELNIYQKINAIQKKISYLKKDKRVSTGGSGSYTALSHDKLIGELRPLMVDAGIVTTMEITSHSIDKQTTQSEYQGKKTERTVYTTVLEAKIKFINIDNPSDFFIVDAIGYGADSGDKGAGKATSYSMKYALLKTFAIESGDDEEDRPTEQYVPTDYKAKSANILAIQKELSRLTVGMTAENKIGYLKVKCKVDNFSELSSLSLEDLEGLLDMLRLEGVAK